MAAERRLILALLFSCSLPAAAAEGERLPATGPLTGQGDLADQMMDGLHTFIERKIAASVGQRARHWKRDDSSPAAYEQSIRPNRERFKKIIGLVEPRLSVRLERYGDADQPALVAEAKRYRIYQVRWSVLDGVWGEGLLCEPTGKPVGHVVALPDADTTPEQLTGLAPGVEPRAQFARRLAENGFRVVVPVLLDRSDRWSGNPAIAYTNEPHREWIYRQAFHMGRHVIGYEVQKVLAAVDWLKQQAGAQTKVGVAGYGEGGLLAFYAAAVDPRIDACLASGYFESRQRPWEEPLYRNVWGLLREFGDAEVATLIAPRGLVVEYSTAPPVNGPPPVRPGRRGGAAGKLTTPPYAAVRDEFQRLDTLLRSSFQARHLVSGPNHVPIGPGSQEALERFVRFLADSASLSLSDEVPVDRRKGFDPSTRQGRQVQELERHVQELVNTAHRTRAQFFQPIQTLKPFTLDRFVRLTPKYRDYFWEEVLGRFDDTLLSPRPRSRKIYDKEKWTGYDVVLDVFPDVFAWGVLLVPKDLRPGGLRPVVVCQHGRGGVPKDVIEGDQPAYHDFAARLAERGFITFAPHNPYRGEDRYRFLSRKANSVKASLFSFILAQHEQILRWLATLPGVDPERIAFYGLSYGGETAVRVPPLLERYCLSICSADFNEWARKVASTDYQNGFMFTIEWEMPYFDMGNTFNYAEMVALLAPRPFMVERGHNDGVAPDEWVAYEYAKVRRLYDQLGIGERTAIEVFNGGHTINGRGTFDFLHQHLRWPNRPGR
jgi:dienelactone hydrolase